MTPIRYGMVGGGPGAFIGAVHRMAASLDREFELVAGAFSADPSKSRDMGEGLGLHGGRVYGDFREMISAEEEREDGIDVVVIVTPNHLHYPVAHACLMAGLHVICDKPMTTTTEHADTLCHMASERGLVFAVTYNYTGYPMVKEARERVAAGELGALRKVVVEYSQGWLRTLLEAEGQKQAEWRGDPDRAGVSSALGDIGTHAFNLLHYVTGLETHRVFADAGTVVEGRVLEDDATVLLELDRGVRGVMLVSQVATGERNHLRLRVYGADGALDWCQEDPNRLRLLDPDGTETMLFRGGELGAGAVDATRLPGGHPEGFIEAFANIYRGVARAIRNEGDEGEAAPDYPTVQDGCVGVHFVHRAVESSQSKTWVEMSQVSANMDTTI
ncbi:MAG: Gfo/Idh/MocA family oxidoreductase [Longimicrobiales bacterium]|nr:Gfo/Idh/MocA family oxidoreductase [Longimicrobiales bacterium]